jgi:hypothetical protein
MRASEEPEWLRRYVDAARRKGENAKYHLDELEQACRRLDYTWPTPFPPIPVQAHFEAHELGRRDEARAMLSEIYGWFTEGFDRADLKEAKALLEELNA